jgi:hypothetical protein
LMSPSSAPVFRHRLCSHSSTAVSGNVNVSPLMLQPLRRAPLSLPTCPWNPRRLGSTPLCPGHHLLITQQVENNVVPPPYHDNDIEAPPLQQLPPPPTSPPGRSGNASRPPPTRI